MKKTLAVLLVLAVALSGAFAQKYKGQTLTILSMSDEFKTNKVVDDFEALTGAKIDLQVVPNEQYLNKLKPLLKTKKNVPDIFVGEAGFIKEVVNLGMSEDLGKAPYSANTKDMYSYAVSMGKDNKGTLRALTWQCTPGALMYRRSIAKEVFGTDDPAAIQKLFADWKTFLDTGKKLADKGITIVPGVGDLSHIFFAAKKKPYIDANNNGYIDSAIGDYFDISKAVRDGNMDAKLAAWSAPWNDAGNTKPGEAKVFSYIWPTWGLFFVMNGWKNAVGDWAMINAPIGYYWGGTWLNIYKDSPNKALAWEFLKMMTQDKAYMEKYAQRTGDFLSDKVVDAKVAPSMKSEILGGQNHYTTFMAGADKIDASGVSADDTTIDALVAAVLGDFLDGKYTKDAAMTEIKNRIKQQFPKVKF